MVSLVGPHGVSKHILPPVKTHQTLTCFADLLSLWPGPSCLHQDSTYLIGKGYKVELPSDDCNFRPALLIMITHGNSAVIMRCLKQNKCHSFFLSSLLHPNISA